MIAALLATVLDVMVAVNAPDFVPPFSNRVLAQVARAYERDVGIRVNFHMLEVSPFPGEDCQTSTCVFNDWEAWLVPETPLLVIHYPGPGKFSAASGIGKIGGIATATTSQGKGRRKRTAATIAHELGHLLGASHLEDEPGRRTIMNKKGAANWYTLTRKHKARLRTNLRFDPVSATQITEYLKSIGGPDAW